MVCAIWSWHLSHASKYSLREVSRLGIRTEEALEVTARHLRAKQQREENRGQAFPVKLFKFLQVTKHPIGQKRDVRILLALFKIKTYLKLHMWTEASHEILNPADLLS